MDLLVEDSNSDNNKNWDTTHLKYENAFKFWQVKAASEKMSKQQLIRLLLDMHLFYLSREEMFHRLMKDNF